jgi:hypothetical protein
MDKQRIKDMVDALNASTNVYINNKRKGRSNMTYEEEEFQKRRKGPPAPARAPFFYS